MTNATILGEQSTGSALSLRETPEEKERQILDNNRHIVSLIRRLKKEMLKRPGVGAPGMLRHVHDALWRELSRGLGYR